MIQYLVLFDEFVILLLGLLVFLVDGVDFSFERLDFLKYFPQLGQNVLMDHRVDEVFAPVIELFIELRQLLVTMNFQVYLCVLDFE